MVPATVDVVADVVKFDASNAVATGLEGANAAPRVEGTTVVTAGMTVGGALSILAYLS